MKVVDPGHRYLLHRLDISGATPDAIPSPVLQFVKREGPGYPGNQGHYPGTNLQEVFRACIDRLQYLDNQIHDPHNNVVINNLRGCISNLEARAAERHSRDWLEPAEPIETVPFCVECGHIGCKGECHAHHI